MPRPTNEEITEARRASIGYLRAKWPRLGPDHDELASQAIERAMRAWDGRGRFGGLVARHVSWLARSLGRKRDRQDAAIARSDVRRPQTMTALREATLAECRRRYSEGTGVPDDESVGDFRGILARRAARAKAARAVLRALKASPEIGAALDVSTLEKWATGAPMDMRASALLTPVVVDETGANPRKYGRTPTEMAVISILHGSWPGTITVGMTPAQAIQEEAAYVRKARSRARARRTRNRRR